MLKFCLCIYFVICYFFTCSIHLEVNPACINIICQHGGSCVYINETKNAVCNCYNNFAGEFCEGITLIYSKPLVCSHSVPTIGTHENSSTYHTKAEIVASLCFSENICGNAAIQPVLISKRIVGGVEAVPNAWPWHISQQKFGESLNPTTMPYYYCSTNSYSLQCKSLQ